MLIIGELINSTRNTVKTALEQRNEQLLRDLARNQYEAGATVLDVNASEMMDKEVETLEWLIPLIQDAVPEARLAIDTADPQAMEVGLNLCTDRPIINSITNEEGNEEIRQLASDSNADIIGLAMGKEGMPENVQQRIAETKALLDTCQDLGIDKQRIYIDTIAMSVGSSPAQGKHVLDAVRKINQQFQVKTSVGLSNISFGLPNRPLINSTFLAMLLAAGLDAALIDPTEEQMLATLKAGECLLARDKRCLNYLQYKRNN